MKRKTIIPIKEDIEPEEEDLKPSDIYRGKLFISEDEAANQVFSYKRYSSQILSYMNNYQLDPYDMKFKIRKYTNLQCKKRASIDLYSIDEAKKQLKNLKQRFEHTITTTTIQPYCENVESKHYIQLSNCIYYLRERILSINKISKITGLKLRTVQKLAKNLKRFGTFANRTACRKSKFDGKYFDYLRKQLEEPNAYKLTIRNLRISLLNKFRYLAPLSISTLYKHIRALGYSYHKLKYNFEKRFDPNIKNVQTHIARNLIEILDKDYDIWFVDEMNYNYNSKLRYGWEKKGKRSNFKIKTRQQSYSIIMAMSTTMIVGAQIIKGGTKGEDYTGFLIRLIQLTGREDPGRNLIIFHDGAPIHKTELYNRMIKSQILTIVNAAYTPQLNPIENAFSKLRRLLQLNEINDEVSLQNAISKSLQAYRTVDIRGYIKHLLNYIEKALEKEDLV